MIIGTESLTKIHKQTFEKYYSIKPNVYYLKKTVDFFVKLLDFCSFVLSMLSRDIELNPGTLLENLIVYSSYLKNRGSGHLPLFFIIIFQA